MKDIDIKYMKLAIVEAKKGLGRGFDALFPEELFDDDFDPTKDQDKGRLLEVKLDKIVNDEDQPRKKFDQAELESLAGSIKRHGVLQPIVLIKKGQKYQIVAGERRFRASQIAGKETVPAVVRTLSDQNKLELSLIENVQRQDLNVIEIATAYLKLKEQFNMTLRQISDSIDGKSPAAISNTMRLLKLPRFVIEALMEEKVTEGQVRMLIGLEENIIKKLLPQIIRHQWSARKVERIVANYKQDKNIDEATKKESTIQKVLLAEEKSQALAKKLDANVRIKPKKKGSGGTIEIKFKNQADFDRISDKLL